MNIQQLIKHKLATPQFGSYRSIAERVEALGHAVPKESSIEHWGAGYPVKRLPANDAIVGLADAFGIAPTEVRAAFLASMGILDDRPDAVLVNLLPEDIDALDNRPDLLEAIIHVVTMSIEKAKREETAPGRPRKKTPPKQTAPVKKTPQAGTRRASTAPLPPQRRRTNR